MTLTKREAIYDDEARRKQIRRHVTKAKWAPRELRAIRKALEAKHGNGPRAQSRILDELATFTNATTGERVAWRRANTTKARA